MELQQQINLKKAVIVLRSVNHVHSMAILDMLTRNRQMTVTEIYIRLRCEQSIASQHLATLRRAGIVSAERDGKLMRYSINPERLTQVAGVISKIGKIYDSPTFTDDMGRGFHYRKAQEAQVE